MDQFSTLLQLSAHMHMIKTHIQVQAKCGLESETCLMLFDDGWTKEVI